MLSPRILAVLAVAVALQSFSDLYNRRVDLTATQLHSALFGPSPALFGLVASGSATMVVHSVAALVPPRLP